jgi:hypothetical protein
VSLIPLAYHPDDEWDRQFLAAIETVGHQLSEAATGFDAQLRPGTGQTAAFYQQLLPNLTSHPDFKISFDSVAARPGMAPTPTAGAPSLSPGGYLVASAIALRGQSGTVGQRLAGEVAFAQQGADWGMVALDQGVGDVGLLGSDVLAAIGRAPLQFTLPGPAITATGRRAVQHPAAASLVMPWSRATIRSLASSDGLATSPIVALLNLSAATPSTAPDAVVGSVPIALTGSVVLPASFAGIGSAQSSTAPAATSGGALVGPALPGRVPNGPQVDPSAVSNILDPLLSPVVVGVSSLLSRASSTLARGLLPPKASPVAGPAATTTVKSPGTSPTAPSSGAEAKVTAPAAASPGSPTPSAVPSPSAASSTPSSTGTTASPGVAPTAPSAPTTTTGDLTPPNTGQTN